MSKNKVQKTIWNRKKDKSFPYSGTLGLIIIFAVFGYFVYVLSWGSVRSNLLNSSGVITKATVIDDKNYWGNSPVSHTFSCSYLFKIKGKVYIGDTRNTERRPGEVVKIKYVPEYPNFNEIVEDE